MMIVMMKMFSQPIKLLLMMKMKKITKRARNQLKALLKRKSFLKR